MAPKRRCPVCGSRQWHKEPLSGLIACSEGHILQNYRNETNEAEDLGNHMMKKRTLKSNKEKKGKRNKADPKLYHGSRGRYLYFQCQQLILRKQINALTKLWNLPAEFEMICRDIWALHLSLLSEPPPDELPFDTLPEQHQNSNKKEEKQGLSMDGMKYDNTSSSRYYRSQSESPSRSRSRNARLGASTPETRASSPVPSESPSSTSDEEDGEDYEKEDRGRGRKANRDFKSGSARDDSDDSEDDPELAELLRQNSESEDEDGDDLEESEGDSHKPAAKAGGRRKHGHDVFEGPANNIAVLVVACWTLRIPILYRDFIKHIESYDLPYLDPIRLLPRSMVVHLTKHNVQALSPARAPKALALHGLVSHLAKQLYRSYGIITPEANAAPILWRVIQSIGGTPTLYSMTKQLSVSLSLPLALHHSLVPPTGAGDVEVHKYDNAPVEVSLMAAAIVVLKMVYGLDGKKRSPQDPDDPAYALPRIEDYLELVKQLQKEDLTTEGVLRNSEKAVSVEEADDVQLDEYLAFCEWALLRPEEETEEDQILKSHFPVKRGTKVSGLESDAGSRRPRLGATAEGDTGNTGNARPGETYTIYDSKDLFGNMAEESWILIRRAGAWTGVGEEYICGIVEKFERRVVRKYKRGRK